jgi:dihydroxy-acid dehydratase
MNERKKRPEDLRSARWFAVDTLRAFGHRSRTAQMGYDRADYQGKPVIAIVNTWNDISPCHSHFKQRVEEIKRGVWQAGGFPIEIPALSLSENFMKPTTMLYRNLLAMEVEEALRAHPVDGCVVMGGCDKTTPGVIMGATSANLPMVYFPAGAMLRGNWRGKVLGSGSDVWKYHAELRAGRLDACAWREMEDGIARSAGTCMTMGTAATMMSIAEVLGLALPNASSIPAVDSAHPRMASACGRRAVELVWEDLKPRDILTRRSFENAITLLMALGGSTNAVVHVIAMAGRAGIAVSLDDFDRLSRTTPLLCNLRPSGDKYLMEDFHYAGGLRAFLSQLGPHLHLGERTVTGATLGEDIAGAEVFDADVIRSPATALAPEGGLVILRGSLAPAGAVLKISASDPKLQVHTGRAVVFDDYNDLDRRLDDEALDVDASSVLVLRNAGPLGGPGFPEWGMLPIPKKLLRQGVRDMVRLSDGRMSGTSYGTCIVHVAPESFVGGPLALVKEGDLISLDVPARRLDLLVEAAELDRRRAALPPPVPRYPRGYGALFSRHISQADKGCDFDFLEGTAPIAEPEIH